jgi:antitoxin MazE
MKLQIQRWGNSLALRIPEPMASEAALSQGASVEMTLEAGRLIIELLHQPQYCLEQLLTGVTDENLQAETNWGAAVGQEAWS